MRRAAMLLLVALLVGALPAAAVPISMFPEPFVKAGTIYTSDGKATMAIIIGDKAATFDMIGAAMLAMKIGSHLYYTNAPYVNVDDAAAHGITLYYGGFDANEYNETKMNLTMVDQVYPTAEPRALYYCYNVSIYHKIAGNIFNLSGRDCNPEYSKGYGTDYVLMPLDQKLNPARFHYILGEYVPNVADVINVHVDPSYGLYPYTGMMEFSNTTGDVNIPWLGFKLHVDNIYINSTTGEGYIRMRMIAPESGATVAFLNVTNLDYFPGPHVYIIDPDGIYIKTKVVLKNLTTGKNDTITRKGTPYFYIGGSAYDWIVLPQFKVILTRFTFGGFRESAVAENIAYYYGDFGAKARFSVTTYPVTGAWAVWNATGYEDAYIWSKDVFPWFKGAVNAYFINESALAAGNYVGDLYVFNGTNGIASYYGGKEGYGIGLWKFNETKRIGCYDFLFSSIGNRTETTTPVCPLTETVVSKEYYCTFICGKCAGVYRVNITRDVVNKLSCGKSYNYITFDTTQSLVSNTQEKATVYPRGATGVFSGIFDRFENVTGFKGTTQLKIETSGNVTYAKDVTQPADVDQVFSGEAVFSFVKMPIIYLDSWVFVNNTLSDAVKDKDLILIGGPAVNTIVKYLNDAKLLDVTFTQVNGVWALSYAGKTYDLDTVLKILVDQGYLPAPISKDYIYRVEGGNGLGVVEYAKKNPFGSGNILVVAGTDRYGTLAASVALADPTKLASSTAPVFYAAGRTAPNAVILLGIKPTAVPPPTAVPALTPVIVAIPAGAAG